MINIVIEDHYQPVMASIWLQEGKFHSLDYSRKNYPGYSAAEESDATLELRSVAQQIARMYQRTGLEPQLSKTDPTWEFWNNQEDSIYDDI